MAGIYTRKIGSTADHLVLQLTGRDGAVQDLTGVTSVVVRVEGEDDIPATISGDPTLGQISILATDLDELPPGSYKIEQVVTFAGVLGVQHYPRGDAATYLDPFDVLILEAALVPAPAP